MKIAVFSTLSAAPWGGSEELWSQAAAALLRKGHEISVSYPFRRELSPELATLRELGAQFVGSPKPFDRWSFHRSRRRRNPALTSLHDWMRRARPDLVLISMSWHLDDLSVTHLCRDAGIPYCLLVQAASPNLFLGEHSWNAHRSAFSGAERCFFVSQQNRDLMEANLGVDLSKSQIVDNPFCVNPETVPKWPVSQDPWRLACVGRIDFQSKAQDVLIQTLRRPQWRDRPLELTLFGADFGNERQVRALIELYGLQDQVRLGGFVDDIAQVWRDHHALVLPSRNEGNPLAMIEAMVCGRVPIVTNVGRVSELVDDNVTGFVAAASTVPLLEDALERAWRRRHKWKRMGAAAAVAIRKRHSLRPAEDFADALLAAVPRNPRILTSAA